jgi:hypothetical protein
MKKKTTLSHALLAATGRVATPSPPVSSGEDTPRLRSVSTSASREGKKAIAGFFDPAVSRQLKQIGLEKDMSVQDLLREALNDLFEKHGRARIA